MTTPEAIRRGLVALGIDAEPGLPASLGQFIEGLQKWNKVYNLTAIRDPNEILHQHIFDSLSVHRHISGEHIVDVGTGGGFPGIPLALLRPDIRFVLLDSNGKKTRFLQQMVIELGLSNCEVVKSRAESYEASFDGVICRAFASLKDIVGYAGHLVRADGKLLAMKGQPEVELAEVPAHFSVEGVYPLAVPGLDAARHLVVLTPDGAAKD